VSAFPLPLYKSLKLPELIRILNCGPARVDITVDSRVDGAPMG
jgi:hypothetical protein